MPKTMNAMTERLDQRMESDGLNGPTGCRERAARRTRQAQRA